MSRPLARPIILSETAQARLWALVEVADGCRIWHGTKNSDGYGVFRANNKSYPAHRCVYTYKVSPVPVEKVIDHLCRNRACMNPEHMQIVSHEENVARGKSFGAYNAQKLYCSKGHPLFGDNLAFKRGQRICTICYKDYTTKSRKRYLKTSKGKATKAKADKKRTQKLTETGQRKEYYKRYVESMSTEKIARRRELQREATRRYRARKAMQ